MVAERSLVEINRRFYESHGESFSGKRQHYWRGWDRCLQRVLAQGSLQKVVDAGCGNGRFAKFLHERLETTHPHLSYRGVDQSHTLLSAARELQLPTDRYRFMHGDLLTTNPLCSEFLRSSANRDRKAQTSWIALWGVMHHIPGHARREALLCQYADVLDDRDYLSFTLWRFEREKRFSRKEIPWDEMQLNPEGGTTLEEGDLLLRWGTDDENCLPRYCHRFCEDEVFQLTEALSKRGMVVADRFSDDGSHHNLNDYFLLQKSR